MSNKSKYLFGPVASRRLGLSLGVDIVPLKSCTQNCIYCQLGIDGIVTLERKPFVPIDDVIEELKVKITAGLEADYITLSGSGEPTLNSQLGLLIDKIRKITKIPVAVITNGTLLGEPAVRADCSKADVVLPSIDAGDRATFEKINRPHKDIDFDAFVEGLCVFRAEFSGQIWLEVFLLDGINSSENDATMFKEWIEKINPDKVHINTAVRPSAEIYARQVSSEKLLKFCSVLGEKAEIIVPYADSKKHERRINIEEELLDLLARRPCSLSDISSGLNVHKNEILKYIEHFVQSNKIVIKKKDHIIYYQTKS